MSPSERGRRSVGFVAAVAVLLAACGVAAPVPSDPAPSARASVGPAPDLAPRSRGSAARGPERLAPLVPTRPAEPVLRPAYRAALVADHCTDRDLAAPPTADMALSVLDRSYALGPGYAPQDLVAASAAGLTGASGSKLVRAVVIDDLAAMRAGWEAAGLAVLIDSAYRSYAAQATTFASWSARVGPAAAALRVARPGHSEHQLGTAIDVSSAGWSGRFGDWAVESAEGAWMAAHAWEYGFVMSYPNGAQGATCFGYEPWHYRWVGREVAAEHRASGLPLRQFLAERSANG